MIHKYYQQKIILIMTNSKNIEYELTSITLNSNNQDINSKSVTWLLTDKPYKCFDDDSLDGHTLCTYF